MGIYISKQQYEHKVRAPYLTWLKKGQKHCIHTSIKAILHRHIWCVEVWKIWIIYMRIRSELFKWATRQLVNPLLIPAYFLPSSCIRVYCFPLRGIASIKCVSYESASSVGVGCFVGWWEGRCWWWGDVKCKGNKRGNMAKTAPYKGKWYLEPGWKTPDGNI